MRSLLDELSRQSSSPLMMWRRWSDEVAHQIQEGSELKRLHTDGATFITRREIEEQAAVWTAGAQGTIKRMETWGLFFNCLPILLVALIIIALSVAGIPLSIIDYNAIAQQFSPSGGDQSPLAKDFPRILRNAVDLAFLAATIGVIAILFLIRSRNGMSLIIAMVLGSFPIGATFAVGYAVAHQASEIRILQAQYADARNQREDAEYKLKIANNDLEDFKDKIDDDTGALLRVRGDISAYKKTPSLALGPDGGVLARGTHLMNEVEHQNKNLKRLSAQEEDLVKQKTNAIKKKEQTESDLDKVILEGLGFQAATPSTKTRNLDQRKTTLQIQIDHLKASIAAIDSDLNRIKASMDAARAARKTAEDDTSQINGHAFNTLLAHSQVLEIAKIVIQEKEGEEKRLSADLDDLNEKKSHRKSEAAELDDRVKKADERAREFESKLTLRQAAVDSGAEVISPPEKGPEAPAKINNSWAKGVVFGAKEFQGFIGRLVDMAEEFLGANEFRLYLSVFFTVLFLPPLTIKLLGTHGGRIISVWGPITIAVVYLLGFMSPPG